MYRDHLVPSVTKSPLYYTIGNFFHLVKSYLCPGGIIGVHLGEIPVKKDHSELPEELVCKELCTCFVV